MNQIFLQKGSPALLNVPQPLLDDNSVLVQVHYSFISSGTELATINNAAQSLVGKFAANIHTNSLKLRASIHEHGLAATVALLKEKQHQIIPLGYSCSGQVVAIGKNITQLHIGDYVACAGSEFAYHADIIKVPQNLTCKLASNKHLKQASITTIGAIALQGIRRANIQLGDKVCVIGLGLLGQLSVQLAKLSGAHVIGIDIQQERLDLAATQGASLVLNNNDGNCVNEVMFATGHHGADITIITAASASGALLQQAMELTRRKGKVILVGDVKLDFDRNPFYTKEIDLLISCSYGPGRYDTTYEAEGKDYPFAYVRWTEQRNMALFSNLVENGTLAIDALISHEHPITAIDTAFSKLQTQQSLGTVLAYHPTTMNPATVNPAGSGTITVLPFKKRAQTIRTGIVGVGGFSKTKLLPLINALKKVTITALVDTNTAQLISLGRVYGATSINNSYTKIVTDTELDAVVIATPHHLHARQTLDCLMYGKAVLVEKPLAVTFEQLKEVTAFMHQNPKSLVCVDFNRSHAPFIQKIKTAITQRKNPLLIHYRVNAGYLPLSHWTQSAANRGRLIGEACHIFELFCFLTDAQPVSLQINPLHPQSDNITTTDNFIAQVNMSDGSRCSLLYSSLGHNSMSKEYMELFFDGKSIIMDDYKKLEGFGLASSFNEDVKRADKGHQNLIAAFFASLDNETPKMPIPFERIYTTTLLSLIADKLARKGGGCYEFTPLDFSGDETAFQVHTD